MRNQKSEVRSDGILNVEFGMWSAGCCAMGFCSIFYEIPHPLQSRDSGFLKNCPSLSERSAELAFLTLRSAKLATTF